jgi:hypothetical protein
MQFLASNDHKLHAPEFELGADQFHPIFEKPERAEFVLSSVFTIQSWSGGRTREV